MKTIYHLLVGYDFKPDRELLFDWQDQVLKYKDTEMYFCEFTENNKRSVIIRNVIGNSDDAIEWAETNYDKIYFVGRQGWHRKLINRKNWRTETMCLGYYNKEGEEEWAA